MLVGEGVGRFRELAWEGLHHWMLGNLTLLSLVEGMGQADPELIPPLLHVVSAETAAVPRQHDSCRSQAEGDPEFTTHNICFRPGSSSTALPGEWAWAKIYDLSG